MNSLNLWLDSNGSSFSLQVGTATGDKNQISVSSNAMTVSGLGISSGSAASGSGGSSSDGGTITKIASDFVVSQTTTGMQSTPDVATLANGNFVVVWQVHDWEGASEYNAYG